MEKLAAMKPSFLRFPGGNYLEGDDIWDRYEWKTTIGPLVDRANSSKPVAVITRRMAWDCSSFLSGARTCICSPLLAVYAGYSMKQEHIEPGPKLEPYVQDALDEIEYAIGGSDKHKVGRRYGRSGMDTPSHSTWTYVEIGNEDWFDRSGSYEGRLRAVLQSDQGRSIRNCS